MSSDTQLPDGWLWEKLDSVKAEGKSVVSGPFGSNIGKKFFVESGVPVIRGNNLTLGMERFIDDGFVYLTEEKALEFKNCEAWPNDLIFTAAGTIGQVGIIPPAPRFEKYIISNKQLRVRIDQKKVLPLFAYYWFASAEMVSTIQSRNTGSTIPLINLSVAKSLPIPVPPIDVQAGIVDVLSALDDRIALLRETNATLEAMAQALFKSWFVDFDPVHANAGTRAATLPAELQALFPSTFTDTAQGPVPEGWSCGLVGDVALQKKGSVNPLQAPEKLFEHYSLPAFDNSQIPVLEQGEQIKSNKTPLPPSAVLLSKLNPHIPRVWLPFEYGDNAVCSTEFLAYSPINGASKEFIYTLFTSATFLMSLRQLVTGTSNSHQRVKPDHVLGLELVIPSKDVLVEFEKVTNPLFERIGQNRQQAQTLATLRDTLLPRLISGQLRLPDAEAALAEVGV